MAEILGIGMTQAPHLQFTDENMEMDRQRFAELKTVQLRQWRDLDPDQMHASGQHEMLNWICLAGAMEGRKASLQLFSSPIFSTQIRRWLCFLPRSSRGGIEKERR
jgi:hypothetical protein